MTFAGSGFSCNDNVLFGSNDKVVTTAILDRVLHHSHIINIQGDSYRLKEKKESGLINSDIFKKQEELTQKSDEN